MNAPQLVMSEQINNNRGNTLRHGILNALILPDWCFSCLEGHFKCALEEVVPPESQTHASGTVGSGTLVETQPRVGKIDLGFSPALPFTDVSHPA